MPAPQNRFKTALKAGQLQIGCWMGLTAPYLSEITANAGYDWVVVDAEHAPNDLRSITTQLQILEGCFSSAVVRPPIGETWIIKQLLDAGAQSLLIPMVDSAEQARELVAAVTYPPEGVRGVGASLARASRFGSVPDYVTTARDQICLLVQIESVKGMAALDEILAVDGIDGVFIGPADLAADMGYLGNTGASEVADAITGAIKQIAASDKAAGILTTDPTFQTECRDLGATFIATEIDVTLFTRKMREAADVAKDRLTET